MRRFFHWFFTRFRVCTLRRGPSRRRAVRKSRSPASLDLPTRVLMAGRTRSTTERPRHRAGLSPRRKPVRSERSRRVHGDRAAIRRQQRTLRLAGTREIASSSAIAHQAQQRLADGRTGDAGGGAANVANAMRATGAISLTVEQLKGAEAVLITGSGSARRACADHAAWIALFGSPQRPAQPSRLAGRAGRKVPSDPSDRSRLRTRQLRARAGHVRYPALRPHRLKS